MVTKAPLRKWPKHFTGSKEAIKYSNTYMECENQKTVCPIRQARGCNQGGVFGYLGGETH